MKDASFRAFEKTDYEECKTLVNEAWEFDTNFHPPELANLAKWIYTAGALLGSNYQVVAEKNGRVAGFIFGFTESGPKLRAGISFSLLMVWRVLRIKNLPFKRKKEFLAAINNHGLNRSKVVQNKQSEIVLFVVRRDCQGQGYGKRLLSDFLVHCKIAGVTSVIVETNKTGASSFYEQQGFKNIGNFTSPLHEFAAQGGQACMYRYDFE